MLTRIRKVKTLSDTPVQNSARRFAIPKSRTPPSANGGKFPFLMTTKRSAP